MGTGTCAHLGSRWARLPHTGLAGNRALCAFLLCLSCFLRYGVARGGPGARGRQRRGGPRPRAGPGVGAVRVRVAGRGLCRWTARPRLPAPEASDAPGAAVALLELGLGQPPDRSPGPPSCPHTPFPPRLPRAGSRTWPGAAAGRSNFPWQLRHVGPRSIRRVCRGRSWCCPPSRACHCMWAATGTAAMWTSERKFLRQIGKGARRSVAKGSTSGQETRRVQNLSLADTTLGAE